MEEKKEETNNPDIIMSDRMRQIAQHQKMMMHRGFYYGKGNPVSAKTSIARIIASQKPKDKEL